MKLIPKKFVSSAAIVMVAAVGLSACGGDDDKSSSDKKENTNSSSDAGSEPTQETFFTELSSALKDAKTGTFDMTVDSSGQKVTAKGEVSMGSNPAETAMNFDMDAAGQTIEMVLVDSKLYMKMGAATQNKYTVTDLTDSSDPMAKQFRSSLDAADPAKQFDQLKPAVTKFEKKGTDKIDGEAVTEYAVSVDPKKVSSLAQAPAASALPNELTYSMFVDSDNLLRRVTVSAPAEIVVNYTKWGEPVDIKAPPASETVTR